MISKSLIFKKLYRSLEELRRYSIKDIYLSVSFKERLLSSKDTKNILHSQVKYLIISILLTLYI